jgi:hypothetical protein
MQQWLAIISALWALVFSFSALGQAGGTWIGTWESSPAGLPTMKKIGSYTPPLSTIVKGTIRYRIRVSQGGRHIRLRFSNEYGGDPLALAAASLGTAAADGLDAVAGSLKRVTFAGEPSINIPAGALALSDPIDLPVKAWGCSGQRLCP